MGMTGLGTSFAGKPNISGLVQRARLWFTPEGCAFNNQHPRRSCPFFQDHISKKIPSRRGGTATQYLGFTPMNP